MLYVSKQTLGIPPSNVTFKRKNSEHHRIPRIPINSFYVRNKKEAKKYNEYGSGGGNHDKIVINMAYSKYKIIENIAKQDFGWEVTKAPVGNWDIFWSDTALHCDSIRSLDLHQKMNHFPGMYNLHRKSNLARNLTKMRKSFPKEYDFFPKTFLMPAEEKDLVAEFDRGGGTYNKTVKWMMTNKFVPINKVRSKKSGQGSEESSKVKRKIFIAKPEASCQGKGIFLITSPNDVAGLEKYIVQEYINEPFTFNNLKFDLRIYVLVAGCDPLRIYLYRDGLVRFATEQYKKANKQNKGDRYMHLTNFAINKTNPNFTRSQTEKEDRKSHKRSIRDFFTELRENGVKIDACWREIKKIVVKTLCSIQPILKHNYHAIQCDDPFNHGCFELLGFDILIDKNLKPYLLEVNHSPSFSADSQVDKKVKGGLIFDALNMLGVSVKTRSKLKKMKKSHLQQRTITGRRIKLNQGELRERCLKEKDDYMFEMRGCFERIFPAEGDDVWEPYDQFLERADQIYKEFTGGELVRIERRRVVSNIRIASPSKKHEALEKIYGYKSKKRRRKRVVEKPKDSRGENASFSEEQSPRNSQRTRVGGSRLVGFEKLKSTENHKKGGYSRSSTKDQPNSGATKAGYQPKYNSSSRSNLGNKIYLRTSKASKQHSSSKDISSSRFSDSYESTKQAKNREKYGPSQVILEEPEYREENQSQDVLAKSKESSQTGHNGRKPHHRVKIRYPNVKKSSKRPEAVYKMSRSFQPKIRQLSNRRVETKFTQSRETVLDPLKVNSRIVSLRLKGMKAKSPMEGAPGASSDKNGEISLGSHKAIHGPNYSSKSLVPQQRGKRGLRYSQKTSYESKMEKNKKYLVSPYINVDPFLSFNKNYREKMKALGVKLYRDKKLGKAFVSGVAITGKAVGGGAGAASDPLRAVEGDGSGSKS